MSTQISLLDQTTAGNDLPERPPLAVAGLFAGVGGIELGLQRNGHHAVELCENDEAAAAVLRVRFPRTKIVGDVREYSDLPSGTELLTAGFPCQDLSQAGRTLGFAGNRSSLVGEVFRLLNTKCAPEWVLLENVPFMLRLAGGKAIDIVLTSLERLGYRWAYRVVDTRAFGLPQRRRRVFILASRVQDPRTVLLVDNEPEVPEEFEPAGKACGFYWTEGSKGLGWAVDAVPTLKGGSTLGIPSPPAVWHPSIGIVRPSIRDAERLQGFPEDWTAPAEKVARTGVRWKLVGNAVTVDVAEWIGYRLRYPLEYASLSDRLIVSNSKWPNAAYNMGHGRYEAPVSSRPAALPYQGLLDFLRLTETSALSRKAAIGFYRRFSASTLSRPPGFFEALEDHIRQFDITAA
jgi:DNA (cytosine-5)-methyltransferase 1